MVFGLYDTIHPPHAYEVSRELIAHNVVIDYRAQAGICVSPHFYNTGNEVRAVVREMQAIIDSGAWKKHAGEQSFVT